MSKMKFIIKSNGSIAIGTADSIGQDDSNVLQVGTEIYYGGDGVNLPGFGTITELIDDAKWGKSVTIEFDDGRIMKRLSVAMFSAKYEGHGGTRFVTKTAYMNWRNETLKLLNEVAEKSSFKFKGGEAIK